MVIKVEIRGAKRVNRLFANLPATLNKEILKTSTEFMTAVQKSAKLRAPRMTGRLAKSIHLKKTRKTTIKLIVDSPYGMFQDKGFKPHLIYSDMGDRMGGTVGGLFNSFDSAFFVKKFTPFITPALEHNLSNLPKALSRGTNEAIKKASGIK